MSVATPLGRFPKEYLDEYSGNILVSVCALFIVLETVFAALRFYARHLAASGFGWDDALIPLAWLTNVGLCILCITSVYDAGVGRHLAAVLLYNPTGLASWAKSLYALEWLYLTSVALPKLSILCLFLRVFTSRGARLMCYVLIAFVAATWAAYIVATSLQCTPLAYQWDKTIAGGRCFDIEIWYKTTSIPNIATDVVILVLPIPTVLRLKVTILRKLALLLVFLAGSVGLIGSCVRMSIFFTHDALVDNTWASVSLMSWTVIEAGMYLIAACLLALRPILNKLSPKELKSRLRRSGHTSASAKPNVSGGTQSSRHDANYPAPGFVELQSRHEQHGASETNLPLTLTDPHPSLRDYDPEQGFAPPMRYPTPND